MLGFGLIKFLGAIIFTVILVVVINFVGDKAIIGGDLSKDAVLISEEEIAVAETNVNQSEQKSITGLLAKADIKKGAKLSKKCTACHSFDKGGKHKIGPNLWNIVGSKQAVKDGFKYSNALTSLGGEWDYNSLDKFLLKPKKYAPGTKMGFAGIKKIEDRASLIMWLRNQSNTLYLLPNE